MTAFCYDCVTSVFPTADPEQNDMRHNSPGKLVFDVCEGCGPGWFDHHGRKVREIDPRDGNGSEEC